MHEISRHAIHISEVLSVTVDTLSSLFAQERRLYERLPLTAGLGETYREQAEEHLAFQTQMVKGLKSRSDSNYERLKSEITVVRCTPPLDPVCNLKLNNL